MYPTITGNASVCIQVYAYRDSYSS